MTDVRQYVESNFNESQKSMFNFLVESYPETMLVQDGIESQDVLLLLAIFAKIIGKAREQIINLNSIRDIEGLYSKIDSGILEESNKYLLLLMAEDLKSVILKEAQTEEEKLEVLLEKRKLIENDYNAVKNRGTLQAVNNVIMAFLDYVGSNTKSFNVEKMQALNNPGIKVVLDYIEGQVDFLGAFDEE